MVRNNKHGQVMVIGPDGYRFQLVPKAESNRKEPFLGVRLHVSDLDKAKVEQPTESHQRLSFSIVLCLWTQNPSNCQLAGFLHESVAHERGSER
jgi:hypothetical protein